MSHAIGRDGCDLNLQNAPRVAKKPMETKQPFRGHSNWVRSLNLSHSFFLNSIILFPCFEEGVKPHRIGDLYWIVNTMNTDQIMLSPAKRARRCVLNLLVCLVVAVVVYAGFHSDRWSFKGNGTIIATSGATRESGSSPVSSLPVAAHNDSQSSASVRLSMAGSIASAYLVKPGEKQ